jgi:hypothetical protein
MNITDSHPLKTGEWHAERQEKRWIVWHGTQGRTAMTPFNGRPGDATSSIAHWNNTPGQIGTPYLIDRDGTIYRTFKDDSHWISHLGLKGTNGKYDRASVGIELANELELKKIGERYYAFWDDKRNKVSQPPANQEYVGGVVTHPERGWQYWAAFDQAQIAAAIELTLDICARYKLEPTMYFPSTKLDYPGCFDAATILCHTNCRADKTDLILEDWAWNMIRAAGIKPVATA